MGPNNLATCFPAAVGIRVISDKAWHTRCAGENWSGSNYFPTIFS